MKKLLLMIFCMLLSACSITPNTPSQAVDYALNALKYKDVETFNHYSNTTLHSYILEKENFLPTTELSTQEIEFYNNLIPYIQTFDYVINDEIIEDKTAKVSVTFTYYDIDQCIQDNQQSVLDTFKSNGSTDINEYYYLYMEAINNSIHNYFTLTTSKDIDCSLNNHQWKLSIDDPSEFIYNLYTQN